MPDEVNKSRIENRALEGREDDRRIPLVEEIFHNITKSIKTIAIYKHNKERFIEFVEPTYNVLQRFLNQYGNLVVRVEPYAFRFLNAEVYKDTDQYSNISYRFFKEGVRRISFKQGLSINEFLQFILIVCGHSEVSRQAEDIVSQLWLANLEGIELTVIEGGITFIDDNSADTPSREIETDTIVNFLERRLSASGQDIVGFARISASDIGMELESVQQIKGLKKMPEIITAEQRQQIQERFLSEDESLKMQKMRRILMAIIKSDLNDVETEDVMENFILIVDYLLLYDDLGRLSEFLFDIEKESTNTTLPTASRERIARLRLRVQQELNTDIRIERIIQILRSRRVENPEHIQIIFDNFSKETYRKIPTLIEQIDIPENLNIILEILKGPRPHFEEVFVGLLSSKKMNLVNLSLDIIKDINFEGKVERIATLLYSPIQQISKKALEILASDGSEEATQEILKYIDEKKTQSVDLVIHILPLLNEESIADIVLKILLNETLKIDETHRFSLLTRLADVISLPEVESYFNAILNEKGTLLTRGNVEKKKKMAIKALSSSPSIVTYQYLMSHSGNKNCSDEIRKEIAIAAEAVRRRLKGR